VKIVENWNFCPVSRRLLGILFISVLANVVTMDSGSALSPVSNRGSVDWSLTQKIWWQEGVIKIVENIPFCR
jgi:hypothetical protein